MKRSTEWFISGALAFGAALFLFMMVGSAQDRAFWYGPESLPPIQRAIMQISPVMIPALVIFGIVCLGMGVMKSRTIIEERESTPRLVPTSTASQNEIVAREVPMTSCEFCRALIPKVSAFCPTCGGKRDALSVQIQ